MTPRSAQGVLARADGMANTQVWDRCFNTEMVDSACPVSVREESMVLGGSSYWSTQRIIDYISGILKSHVLTSDSVPSSEVRLSL